MPSAPVPTQEEAAYFDYVEGVKQRNYAVHVRGVLDRYRQRVQAITASGGSTPSTRTEAGPFIESDTGYRFAAGVQRASQQMAWAAARRSVDRERANLLRELG